MTSALRQRVTPEEAELTLAAWLRRQRPDLSWSQARGLCESGRVRVGAQEVADSATRVAAGDLVTVLDPEPGQSAGRKEAKFLRYFDRDIAVAAKPAGCLTLPFEEGDRETLLQRVAVELRRAERGRGGAVGSGGPLRVVQRLDKETSGLVVFARHVAAQRALQDSLGDNKLDRVYWAVVAGRWPSPGETRIESFLLPDRGDGRRGSWRAAASERPPLEAKFAATVVRLLGVLARGPASLLECRLETGRTHQIRIHLAERGHPVWGDAVYGRRPGAVPGVVRRESDGPRLMLHARRLVFEHPRTGERMAFEEPPPEDFLAVVRKLGGLPPGVLDR